MAVFLVAAALLAGGVFVSVTAGDCAVSRSRPSSRRRNGMRMACRRLWSARVALAALASFAAAQVPPSPADVAKAVREYRVAHEAAIVQELVTLLSIPNIASDEPNIRRNADLLKAMFERRAFRVRFFEVPNRGPIIFAELTAPGAARTVVFYAHYDGQPVDPKAWTGTGPFEPGLRTTSI
jgi:hypothetical protein